MYSDHDLAISIACHKFDEIHPKEEQPELKSGQYWHWEDDGVPVLFEVDPVTGKKSVVICGGPEMEVEVFFEAEVDLAKDMVTVLMDTDLHKLDRTKYEINRF